MGYFPFFVDLEGKRGLIVGGGTVALRKVEKLLPYGPALTVIAPEIAPEILAIPTVCCISQPFADSDVEAFSFVIAATDEPALNHRISTLCQARRIPINAVDDKDACSFLFPALVRRGTCSIGISTGGASPTAAIYLKEQISALLPARLDEILSDLERLREFVKRVVPREQDRAQVLSALFFACLRLGRPLEDTEAQTITQETLREIGGIS